MITTTVIARVSLEEYINNQRVALTENGFVKLEEVERLNKVLFDNDYDAVIDRKWNVIENQSINIIGYGQIK